MFKWQTEVYSVKVKERVSLNDRLKFIPLEFNAINSLNEAFEFKWRTLSLNDALKFIRFKFKARQS